MKIFLMKVLCLLFARICDLQHIILTDKQDDRLQLWFIDIIGYHCPMVVWSYNINEKYNLNIWKKDTS